MTEAADQSVYYIVDAALKDWRQGDVAVVKSFNHFADLRRPVTDASIELSKTSAVANVSTARIGTKVEGLVVLTQTCDIQRSSLKRPYIELCPLIRIEVGDAKSAAAGDLPRYAALPSLGEDAVADLDRIMTVEKGWLSFAARTQGWVSDAEIRNFQAAVARRYQRFAFPDDFTIAASKLRDKIISRHGKPSSAEGQLFSLVKHIRVKAEPHWSSSEIEVTISFILEADTLGEIPEELVDSQPYSDTLKWLAAKQRTSTEIAERILSEPSSPAKDILWTRLTEAWARSCKPRGCVSSIFGEVRDASEYPISEYWESSPLDLDYLSTSDSDIPSGVVAVLPVDASAEKAPESLPPEKESRHFLRKIFRR